MQLMPSCINGSTQYSSGGIVTRITDTFQRPWKLVGERKQTTESSLLSDAHITKKYQLVLTMPILHEVIFCHLKQY
jgi:hypothetical protein